MFVGISFVFVTLCCLQLASAAGVPKKSKLGDDDFSKIVYPGPIQDLSSRYGTENDTDPCENQNFCAIKPADYPQELFNRMFKGKLKEPIFQPTYVINDNRQGDPDETDECETVVSYEPLYKVRQSGTQEWRTVVQAPEENYLQMVRLETCRKAGKPCFTQFKIPVDLQTLCKQKYSVWEFLVHDGKEGTQKVNVDLPICCSCHYRPK